uniref:Uncharacterized protein n=1 Tax=Physcomitrium patens TaxID=3218 RepID=A0A2K1L6K6_PHYPA|nr:hypothetical protein PHYPA_000067 [Physcomitrium patens]
MPRLPVLHGVVVNVDALVVLSSRVSTPCPSSRTSLNLIGVDRLCHRISRKIETHFLLASFHLLYSYPMNSTSYHCAYSFVYSVRRCPSHFVPHRGRAKL